MLEASMVVIGDEILGGWVTDVNSPLLARCLQAHGVPLTHVHVVADDMGAIDEALQAELVRSRPRLVVTSGGVGSTPDDLTFEAVAASLGRDLVADELLTGRLTTILEWTREQGIDAGDEFAWHLMRMARIPAGSRLLTRERSWLPAVAVDVDGGCEHDGGATVVVLPGVPSEFRDLLAEAVEPRLLAGRNVPPAVEEVTHAFPESALNLTFVDVLERWPDVKLGSYPGEPMIVRLTGPAEPVAQAAAAVRDAVAALEASPAGARLAQAWQDRRAARALARQAEQAAGEP